MQLTKETVLLIIAGIVGVALLTTWFTGSLDADLSQLSASIDADTRISVIGSGLNNANIVGTLRNDSPLLVNVTRIWLFDGTQNIELNRPSIVTPLEIEPYGSVAIRGLLYAVANQDLGYATQSAEIDANTGVLKSPLVKGDLLTGKISSDGTVGNIKLRSGTEVELTFDITAPDNGQTDAIAHTIRVR